MARQPKQPRSEVGGAPTARGSTPLVIVAAHRRPPDFGAFLHPCDFPTTAPRVVEKKKKNRAHEAGSDCPVALSSFIYAMKRMGKRFFSFFFFVPELPEGPVV